MQNRDLNLKLQRIVSKLLAQREIFGQETELIQNNFIKGFYDIIKLSFDINLSNRDIQKQIDSGNINDEISNLRLIAKSIENESTYILLNYYIIKFLREVQEDKKDIVIEIFLENEGVGEEDVEMVLSEYMKYTKS